VNRELGRSPEGDLRRPVQGMMAAYARAKMIARHRRGKRHAARAGAGNGLSGAPDGDREVPTSEGPGQAPEAMLPDEARVVRPVLAWISGDRLTMGEVCRRLTRAGEGTRTGARPSGTAAWCGGW
jgi:site-specific DNA recombinase